MSEGTPGGFDADALRAIGAAVKEELRKRMRAVRSSIPREVRRTRSASLAERVLALPEWERARTVASFVSIRGEVDLTPLEQAAWAAGKEVALPRVDYEDDRVILHVVGPEVALVRGPFGLSEPPPDAPVATPESIDLVLVPGLAVDEHGHRIGYGKGFYDQLLPTLPNAVRCFVGYDFQLVSEVPAAPHDAPMHLVATDARVLRVPA